VNPLIKPPYSITVKFLIQLAGILLAVGGLINEFYNLRVEGAKNVIAINELTKSVIALNTEIRIRVATAEREHARYDTHLDSPENHCVTRP
jgi:hypothetical protein